MNGASETYNSVTEGLHSVPEGYRKKLVQGA